MDRCHPLDRIGTKLSSIGKLAGYAKTLFNIDTVGVARLEVNFLATFRALSVFSQGALHRVSCTGSKRSREYHVGVLPPRPDWALLDVFRAANVSSTITKAHRCAQRCAKSCHGYSRDIVGGADRIEVCEPRNQEWS
jgi:hypothetical protein